MNIIYNVISTHTAQTGSSMGRTHNIPYQISSTGKVAIFTNGADISYTVSYPTITANTQRGTVSAGSSKLVNIVSQSANGIIYVIADGDVGVVYYKESCSQLLSLPTDSLSGLTYVVTTWDSDALVMISSPDTANTLSGVFGGESSQSITWRGIQSVTTNGGQAYTIDVSAQGSYIEMESSGDLTGTTINSNKPISVIVSNKATSVGPSPTSFTDIMFEQLIPSANWGKTFIVPGIPGSTAGYYIKIVSLKENSVVTAVPNVSPVSRNIGANKMEVIRIDSNEPVVVTSNDQLQVIQYVRSKTSSSGSGYPTAIVIPPVEQQLNSYRYVAIAPRIISGIAYNMIVAINTADLGGLRINGNAGSTQVGWKAIPGSNPEVTINTIQTPPAEMVLTHTTNRPFSAFVYGVDNNPGGCSFGFPAGTNLVPYDQVNTCTLTTT